MNSASCLYGFTDEYILTHWALETLSKKVRSAVKLNLQLRGLYNTKEGTEELDKSAEAELLTLYTGE